MIYIIVLTILIVGLFAAIALFRHQKKMQTTPWLFAENDLLKEALRDLWTNPNYWRQEGEENVTSWKRRVRCTLTGYEIVYNYSEQGRYDHAHGIVIPEEKGNRVIACTDSLSYKATEYVIDAFWGNKIPNMQRNEAQIYTDLRLSKVLEVSVQQSLQNEKDAIDKHSEREASRNRKSAGKSSSR